MDVSRRTFLTTGTAAATLAAAPRAFAQWQPSQRYPDPSVQITSLYSLYVNTQGAPGG